MIKIIGVLGRAGAGKDTIAARLVERHHFERVAFADLMKRVVREIFLFTDDQLWGSIEDKARPDFRYERVDGTFLTPREAMQLLGTEFGRRCYPNIWAERGITTARKLLGGGYSYHADTGLFLDPFRAPLNGVVFSDCRFANEVELIRKEGGKVIKVVRPGLRNVSGIEGHRSEAGIDDLPSNHVIHNDGTIDDLNAAVDRFVKEIT